MILISRTVYVISRLARKLKFPPFSIWLLFIPQVRFFKKSPYGNTGILIILYYHNDLQAFSGSQYLIDLLHFLDDFAFGAFLIIIKRIDTVQVHFKTNLSVAIKEITFLIQHQLFHLI